MKLKKIKT